MQAMVLTGRAGNLRLPVTGHAPKNRSNIRAGFVPPQIFALGCTPEERS